MHNHAPADYHCPICPAIKKIVNKHTLIRPEDMIYQDKLVTAFINSFFVGNNPGHVIIVPNEHFENLYDLPESYAYAIIKVAKKIAIAMRKDYNCEGITIRQNNEPASGQHAFHYHLHIFPRYTDDNLDINTPHKRLALPEERAVFAKKFNLYSDPKQS